MNLIELTDQDPWKEEENRYSFYYRGFSCLILRNHSGALCGYVGLTEGHPLFAQTERIPLEVHGGITFSEFGDNVSHIADWFYRHSHDAEDNLLWWVGFHCAHFGDYCPGTAETVRRMGAPEEHYRPKQIGHVQETYRDLSFVVQEIESLVEQLTKES